VTRQAVCCGAEVDPGLLRKIFVGLDFELIEILQYRKRSLFCAASSILRWLRGLRWSNSSNLPKLLVLGEMFLNGTRWMYGFVFSRGILQPVVRTKSME
jgi:hypothetical protein